MHTCQNDIFLNCSVLSDQFCHLISAGRFRERVRYYCDFHMSTSAVIWLFSRQTFGNFAIISKRQSSIRPWWWIIRRKCKTFCWSAGTRALQMLKSWQVPRHSYNAHLIASEIKNRTKMSLTEMTKMNSSWWYNIFHL